LKKQEKTRAVMCLALACAPLTLMAQSSISLGGRLKTGVDNISYAGGTLGAGAAPSPRATRLTDNSSYWFIKGEEDLGGGSKVFFHVENGFSSDTGEIGSPRFSAVGLSHPAWGRLLLGRWSTYFASDSMLTPGGINDAGPYASGTLNLLGPIGKKGQYFSGGFLSNLVRYDSPRWHGVTVAAAYSFDTETAGQSGNRTLNLNPVFTQGPVTLYANVLKRLRQPNASGSFTTFYDQTAARLGAGYEFASGFKAAALWDRNKVAGSAIAGQELSRDAWAVPVSYRSGAHLWSVTYGRALAYKTGGATTANTGAQMFSMGYEYALSPRTYLAANLSTVRNEAAAAYDFWQTSNTLSLPAGMSGFRSRYAYVGVKHLF